MLDLVSLARAYYWLLTLVLALAGSYLTIFHHAPPYVMLIGVALVLFGTWKVRPISYLALALLCFAFLPWAIVVCTALVAALIQ
jgi:hypothetical protein